MHENRETSGASRSNQDRDRSVKAQSHNAGHARAGGVGLRRSTDEPAEQRGAIFGGGWGGKGADQGEHRSVQHEPDTERGTSVPGIERCATSSQGKETGAVHCFAAPCERWSAPGQLLRLKRQAAPGVDGVTWKEYETGLEDRLVDLHSRVHRGAYQAQPSRRVYIPKADGRQRPLGIAALEDKIVQQAVVTILNQIYEVDFKGFSYGFRPGRNPHQALDALTVGIQRKRVNWVLDADIRGFFDNLSIEWAVKFIEHRVADPRILRLIQKWLKAGVSEDGQWSESKVGTPQGAVVTPLTQKVISNLRGYCRGGGLFVRSLTYAVKGNMFMADGPVDQSRQGSAAECSLRNAAAQGCLARGHAALIPTVRPVRTSSISLPGRSDQSRPTGRSFGSCGTDHAQAPCGNGSPSASLCQKQRPDNRSDRDARFGGVSRYSEKAWLSRANPMARFKFRLNMHLIAGTMRSSAKPTVFWCPFGSVRLAGV